MENKKNYYLEGEKILQEVASLGQKPKLLVHSCCGPCSAYPLVYLFPYFDITIYFNNSNIYPEEEYTRRLNELKFLLDCYKKDYGFNIEVVETPYDNENYNKTTLEPLKEIPEGGLRCFTCYEKRMRQAMEYASNNSFDYFTTVMTISRFKNAQKLNEIGERLSKDYPSVKYFFSDFKKNNGQLKRNELVRKYKLYEQQYCGCIYSYEEMLKRKQNA